MVVGKQEHAFCFGRNTSVSVTPENVLLALSVLAQPPASLGQRDQPIGAAVPCELHCFSLNCSISAREPCAPIQIARRSHDGGS